MPSRGRVLYRGKDLRTLSSAERRAFCREVQPIFQDPFEVYNPFYKVDHVLTMPVRKFQLAASRAEARALIRDAVERVGLRPDEILGRFPHELSGGQRQRIMVARALLLRPRAILADEPVSMVDASLRAIILESLRTLNRELGICLVYITHDLTTAYQICDHIVVLYRGSVVEAGAVGAGSRRHRNLDTRLLVGSMPPAGHRADVGRPTVRWSRRARALPRAPWAVSSRTAALRRCRRAGPRRDHESEALKVLGGLGFSTADAARDAGEFSGGWQMRLALAKLLLRRPASAYSTSRPTISTSKRATGSRSSLSAIRERDPRRARSLLPRRRRAAITEVSRGHTHRLPPQLQPLPRRARGAARAASAGVRGAAGGDRAHRGVHPPLPLPGVEGRARAEPHQAAREDRTPAAARRAGRPPSISASRPASAAGASSSSCSAPQAIR